MTLAKIINKYARPYSPYMSGLVNHLPMGQLALYMMENDVAQIKSYSEGYIKSGKIDQIKKDYSQVNSLEECLGKRELYEGCLDHIKKEVSSKGVEKVIKTVLNNYPLGMSSGLFHTIIRLAYGAEGMELDQDLTEEVARALAYYVTAYRAGKEFRRKVPTSEFTKEVKELLESPHIIDVISSAPTRGRQIKVLYQDERYLKEAPLIEGDTEDKITGLLELLLPLLDETNNIVILHCITGLHALLVLEEYFDDFSNALDIMTACIITHLLTVEGITIEKKEKTVTDESWETITRKASNSPDVHTIKFVYSAHELYAAYELPALKKSALKRVEV